MCLFPKLITNPKYKKNKKNGGIVPPFSDERVLKVPIGCGQCKECLNKKKINWKARLLQDIKTNPHAKFITLTFSNESYRDIYNKYPEWHNKGYDLDNKIATVATRLFLERWRKEHKVSLRHWLVTELGHGQTEHIHIHGIVWTNNEGLEKLETIWKYGFVWRGYKKNEKWINYVNEKTIGYITKYITKQDDQHRTYKPIVLTSAGIGDQYTNTFNAKQNKYKPNKTIETFKTYNGQKIAIPIYWRNKIYSEEEREKLWLEKLDRNERYILGKKIDVKNGTEEYDKMLKHAQQINKEQGYGGEVNWEREAYERELRILKQKEKIYKK